MIKYMLNIIARKKTFFLAILFLFLIAAGFAVAQSNSAPLFNQEYVPGELLVKYKSGVTASSIKSIHSRLGMRTIKHLKIIDAYRLKLPSDLSVEYVLEIYKNDPNIEYAEPNYLRHRASTIPNDFFWGYLWGLNNTGQPVNNDPGGTSDADIDATEAWDIVTGSSSVVIAVIDTGVDYYHPDLVGNIIQGWDFVDNDNDPMDVDSHGTHVAGIMAAKGHNNTGVAGVCWNVRIMPVRFLDAFGNGSVSDEVDAIDYAIAHGAKIINASFGGYSTASDTERAAISSANNAGILFVAAAGNDAKNNDSEIKPFYPASYDLPNIISVAATDQNDALCSFSNYGRTSVDVGAPGKSILSAMPIRQTAWSDNFSGGMGEWSTGGTSSWEIILFSGNPCITDSSSGSYENNTSSWIQTQHSFSGLSGTKLEFQLRGSSETGRDYLKIKTSTNGVTWQDQTALINTTFYTNGISGNLSDNWKNVYVDLGAYDGEESVYIQFFFTSDDETTADGWYIDNVKITAADPDATSSNEPDVDYQYMNGTSMATPHVSGLAGLLWSFDPDITLAQVKECILATVDKKDALNGKTVSGGRINAFNALDVLRTLRGSLSGLTSTAISSSRINLSWTDNIPNELGFKIERKTETDLDYTQIATAGRDIKNYSNAGLSASTTYYYRIRAYNIDGDSGYSDVAFATTADPSSGSGEDDEGGDSGGGGGGGGICFIASTDTNAINPLMLFLMVFVGNLCWLKFVIR
jgi:subtilisin family serine protease